ncbi:hypothetical protein GC173_19070, partial [bacterium]|nr:hypothetical protein [bacterium]
PATLSEAERPVYEQQKKFSDDIRKMFSDVSAKFRQSAGGVGIFGFIGVLVTAGLLYYSIESVVNQTWQTGATRWTDTVRNLILVLLFAPIVIGLSMTASTMAATLFGQDEPPEKVVTKVEMAAAAETSAATDGTAVVVAVPEPTKPEPVITAAPPAPAPSGLLAKIRSVTTQFGFIIKVLPLLINTMILTLAYAFLPNTKVKFVAALTGGLVASLLWELARYGFFYYVYMSTVNKTLADALGLSVIFLIWVYITWMILLVGNLVVYVVHNFNALWMERRAGGEMMLDGRLLVATMLLVARRFKHHAPGYTESELRERLSLRKDEFTQVIGRLLRAGYVVRQESGAYILAQPPEDIRVRDLLEMGCNLAKLPVVNRIGPVSSSLMQLQQETLDGAGDRRLNELLVA